jgi:UDP-glucose 4-epimerase
VIPGVLVTGATGFVGTALIRAMASDAGRLVTPATRPRCDLASPGWSRALEPEKSDVVFHLAQSRRYLDGFAGAADVFAVNVAATFELLQWARQNGVRRFVLASSGSVYRPASRPVTESDATSPRNPYAASKLAAEALAMGFAADMEVVVVRPFTVYGPGQRQMIVARLAASVQSGEPIQLAGGEGSYLTPTYIDDCVAALRRLADIPLPESPHTVNVAGPEMLSVRQMASTIGDLLGRTPVYHPHEGATSYTAGDGSRCVQLTGVHFRKFVDGINLMQAREGHGR